ncbi:M48 family metallopeptidase [Variovorax sp. PAMC 28711]|uniref:M48 family metallopeptidase n=1 Tax=Variovorax sp. PAMC 28711 TaxID=1795631 RepID=UPI00078E3063|nr:M48 family metallopeptidase [Variovorax sp. PAMC 28711]AMM26013.1 peptidase M48 [Variovorax sp. PAMC 28711]
MTSPRTVQSELLRTLVLTLVSLFVIPAATLFFTHYVARTQDAAFLQSIEQRIAASPKLSGPEREEALGFYRSHPLSGACDATADEDRDFHDKVCERYGFQWQFHWVERLALWTIIGGGILLATALALGAIAFVNRGLQYASFVTGWRLMTASSAVEVLVQSVMVVWLSFWVTAYFWERYYIKLVGVAGIAAAVAVFYAIWTLFKKLPAHNEIEGELLAEQDAPRLWQRVRELAAKGQTAPPDQIIAGIDTNFFVTESPGTVGDSAVRGRTLFVSVPLLRVLSTAEADAVLAHELAHLGGGDTRSSALLGPKLRQFDQYAWQMRSGGLTIVAHYVLRLYRMIFEFALARDSREREYMADRAAATLTAPESIVQSLIKISAYASYRNDVERRLFAESRRHEGDLGIARFVAEGLHPYAGSPDFLETMKTANVPHPYDSHPPLLERMRNVGHSVDESRYAAVVTAVPAATWVEEMPTAAAIEARLWNVYEQRFAANHEYSLAYRYEPSNDEEREIVLRYFPPVVFDLSKGARIEISYAGIHADASESGAVSWDDVGGLSFKDGNFGASLVISHHDKGVLGARKTKISLKGIGKHKAAFDATVSEYWRRHQIMRAQQAEARDLK